MSSFTVCSRIPLLRSKHWQTSITRFAKVFASPEINSLDNDVQSVVYDNYSKFISAAEIVKSIHSKAESLNGVLAKLKKSVGEMTIHYKATSEVLDLDFNEIHRLDTLQADFEKLKFLRDLPLKLGDAIKEYEDNKKGIAAFQDCLQNYFISMKLLEKYKNTASFNALYSEISTHVDKIRFLLKKEVINFQVNQ